MNRHISITETQWESRRLSEYEAQYEDEPEPRKTFRIRGREVYRDSLNGLHDARTGKFVKGVE